MKTKTIKLYEYSELSTKAKERALENYHKDGFDSYELQVHLDNEIEPLLEKHHITPVRDDKGYPTTHARIYFSLSKCQGDGVMFENTFNVEIAGNKYIAYISQSGHYYHKYSRNIDWRNEDGSDADEESRDYKEFIKSYESICDALENKGYAYIEDMLSEEYFIEACNMNEWTFREDGRMENS